MDQLPLNISPRILYAPEGFLLHDGVQQLVELCENTIRRDDYKTLFITGAARSGKTHLAILLAEICARNGLYPKLLDGKSLTGKLAELIPVDSRDVLIVDDAQEYFDAIAPGQSGPLVGCVELYRKAKGGIIFLSSREIEEFSFDEHIRSRLLPGGGLSIKTPAAEYLPELIDRMAKQRGIKLTEKKIAYLLKRLSRNIQEIEEYIERVNYLSSVFGRSIKFPLLSDAL